METESGPWDIFVPSAKLIACMTKSYEILLQRSCNLEEVASLTPMVRINLWRFCSTVASAIESQGGPVGQVRPLTTAEGKLEDWFAKGLMYRMRCHPTEQATFLSEVAEALTSLARVSAYHSSWWSLELQDKKVVIRLTAFREKELPSGHWVKATVRKRTV